MAIEKEILVLGRRDHAEAMRVAAGLTIVGHRIELVLMTGPVEETEENAEQAELLDLCEIVPKTTVMEMGDDLELLSPAALALAMASADQIISV